MKKSIILFSLLSFSLMGHALAGCDLIALMIDNQSEQAVELQSEAGSPVLVSAGHKQRLDLKLISYKEKFCSVMAVRFDGNKQIYRYVLKPKRKEVSILIDKEKMISVKGLTGPLQY